MNKIIKLLIMVLILNACLLNGCIQQDKNYNIDSTGADSDNDGYSDDEDDYPTDSNLHEKNIIISGSETFEKNQGIGGFLDIDSNCKFVVVNWTVLSPQDLSVDEQQDIVFELTYPPNDMSKDYPYDIVNNRNLRFTVTSSNWGKWSYGFVNGGVISNVTIFREISILS